MLQKIQRIAIPEGGRARGFTTGKIETALQGGGSCLWVPESAVRTGRLYARQNGVHRLGENYYGAGEVVVNVNGYADNGDRIVYPGPGGVLMEDNSFPVKIQIDTPPDKLEYEDGEKIDLTGIVVRAYKANGDVWTSRDYPDGIVPVDELTATPGTATEPKKVKTSDFGLEVDALYSDDFPVTADIHIIRYSTQSHSYPPYDHSSYQSMETDQFHGRWDEPAIYPYAALVKSTPANEKYYGEITETYDYYNLWVAGASRLYASSSDGYYDYSDYYVHNHKSIWLDGPYWWGAGNLVIINPDHNLYAEYETETNVPIITTDGTHSIAQYLWTAIYGEPRYIKEIVVSWTRPQDGKVLNAAYIIDVTGVEEEEE